MNNNTSEFYSVLARAIKWRKEVNDEYKKQAEDKIMELEKQLPFNTGADTRSSVDLDSSNGQKIVIHTTFQHINENGYLTFWTLHKVIITPCLINRYKLKITGSNWNSIKDYLYDQFDNIFNY